KPPRQMNRLLFRAKAWTSTASSQSRAREPLNRDNSVKYKNLTLQIDKQSWKRSLDGCRVTVYQHLDDTITIGFGPQQVGKYTADDKPVKPSETEHRPVERKGRAPFFQKEQTGHLMC